MPARREMLSSEDKTEAAARTLAEHDRRFDCVDAQLATIRGKIKALEAPVVMVKWITGATFAGILALIQGTFDGG